MFSIRPARPSDLEAFYLISLKTGHQGKDASKHYKDPKMMGHIYSAPYLLFSPQNCWVVTDEHGTAGFAVGAVDTRAFEKLLQEKWWPKLCNKYPKPSEKNPSAWSLDEKRTNHFHHPKSALDHIVATHPSHVHLNLHPRLQGQGVGQDLLSQWLAHAKDMGATHVHIGINPHNDRAIRFWSRNGFQAPSDWPSPKTGETLYLGKTL